MRWVAVAQMVLWAAIGLGAFLLLDKSVENSAQFDSMKVSILAVDACAVIVLVVLLVRRLWRLVRDYRAHRRHLRRAGHCAALDRLPVIARVHQPRHRQLVHRGGQAGPE
jgi:uncharacterized membrane-anchored protein